MAKKSIHRKDKPPSNVIPFPTNRAPTGPGISADDWKPPGPNDAPTVVIDQDLLEAERTLTAQARLAAANLKLIREHLLETYLRFGAVQPGRRRIEAVKVRRAGGALPHFYRIKVN